VVVKRTRTAPAAPVPAGGYPAECWLTPRATVRRSPIHGRGLFATAPIPAGEAVMRLGGELIDDATLATLIPPYSSLTVGAGRHLLLDPAHPACYGNHSCDPSLWHADAVSLIARSDVAVGQELTVDYATHTGAVDWSMPCRCGSDACRGTVTGQDWRSPRLRAAYGGHWSPALLQRIQRVRAGR
jgi:uncharacterized protein